VIRVSCFCRVASVLGHELKAEPETHSDEEHSEHEACPARPLSLSDFVLPLPFAPPRVLGLFHRRDECTIHLPTITKNTKPDCSIVNIADSARGLD